MSIDEVKEFLRIDGNDDDALITALTAAAEQYVKNATRPDVDTKNDLYNLAVKILVTHWYENREPVGTAGTIAFSLESMLIQLSYLGSGA